MKDFQGSLTGLKSQCDEGWSEKNGAEMGKSEEERRSKTDLEFGVDSVKSTHQMFEEEFKGLW